MYFFIALPDFHNQYEYMGGIFNPKLLPRALGAQRLTMDTTPMRLFSTAPFSIITPTSFSSSSKQTAEADAKRIIQDKGLDFSATPNTLSPEILLTSVPNTLFWLDGIHKNIIDQTDLVDVNKYAKFTNIRDTANINGHSNREAVLNQMHKQEYHRAFPFGQQGERPPGYRWYYWPMWFVYRTILPDTYWWINMYHKRFWLSIFERHMKKNPYVQVWYRGHRLPYPRFRPKIPSDAAYDININNICLPTSIYALFRDLSSTVLHTETIRPLAKRRRRAWRKPHQHLQHPQDYESRPLILLDPSFGISQFAERPLGNFEALELLTLVFIFLASVLYIFSALRLYFIVVGT